MITLRQSDADEQVEPSDVRDVIENTSIVDVNIDRCQCGPVQGIFDASEIQIRLGNEPPEFGISDDGSFLLVKVTHVLYASTLRDPTPEGATTLSVTHVITFRAEGEASHEFSSAQLSAFVQTNVYFMIYPYARQFFNYMSQEMGLPPIVLGYRRREDWPSLPSRGQDHSLGEPVGDEGRS